MGHYSLDTQYLMYSQSKFVDMKEILPNTPNSKTLYKEGKLVTIRNHNILLGNTRDNISIFWSWYTMSHYKFTLLKLIFKKMVTFVSKVIIVIFLLHKVVG